MPRLRSLLLPGALYCSGCGRFRYQGLRRFAVAVLVIASAIVAFRLWWH